MSMFRRQTESSSSSESGSDEYDDSGDEVAHQHHHREEAVTTTTTTTTQATRSGDDTAHQPHSNGSTEEELADGASGGHDGTSTEILFADSQRSAGEVSDQDGGSSVITTAAHRDMMLAGLLEHYYQTRALDFLVATKGGGSNDNNYHRGSPEVLQLARQFLAQASQTLSATGILKGSETAEENWNNRRQYLSGLDKLALPGGMASLNQDVIGLAAGSSTIKDLVIPMRDSLRLSQIPHPATDLQLTSRHQQQQPRSHYRTSFEEMSFLGKGGFGSVFKCWNRFDDRLYAVKKIPLSPRLSRSFCEGGHSRLGKLLREVRALATFDHSNIVRYHATWIEEPAASFGSSDPSAGGPFIPRSRSTGQPLRLLEHRPLSADTDDEPSFSDATSDQGISDGGVVFGFDTGSDPASANGRSLAVGPQWSEGPSASGNRVQELSTSEGQDSDIFTDGDRNGPSSRRAIPATLPVNDPNVHVLHIQMSLYPMTLAQYLSPTRAPTHCFHLLPSLRLLLYILTGLQYIHSKGLIHRDIKPGNIFLSPACQDTTESVSGQSGFCNVGDCEVCYPTEANPVWYNPRIGDFGLVTQLAREGLSSPDELEDRLRDQPWDVSSDKDENLVGTLYYRPPRWPLESQSSKQGAADQIDDGEYNHETDDIPPTTTENQKNKRSKTSIDEKVDIFALGVVLVEMMTCCPTAMQRVDMLKSLQEGQIPADIKNCAEKSLHEPRIVDEVVDLVGGMLEVDPTLRWDGTRVRVATERIISHLRGQADLIDL